jgi:sugar phosphate isomerase/epimerase
LFLSSQLQEMTRSILDRISYHAVYDRSVMDALRYAKRNGFAGIQLADETPHLSFERLDDAEAGEIAEFASLQSLYINLHAPDDVCSLFQCSRYLADGIANYFEALFAFGRRIGSRLVTIHAGSMTTFGADDDSGRELPGEDGPLYETAFRENVETLLRLAGGDLMVCVENYAMQLSTLDLLIPYLERGDLFLCWDLAKSTEQPEIEEIYSSHLNWVKQVHLHDVRQMADGRTRGHRVIGSGDVDFARYLRILRSADVEDYCIEVRPREKAKESLKALRAIIDRVATEAPPTA